MAQTNQQLRRRILKSSLIGNALEFYDFTLCGVFVSVLAKVFFSTQGDTSSILWGFFAFSAAFWTRPLGAFIFGYIGDRFGRKVALTWSVSLMGIPTLIISLLPGYETLGFVSPIILILCRMLQGLCTGGEYNGAAIFALEHLKNKPGFISGLISGSCVIGALSAIFMGFLTTQSWMPDWAWRVPFAMGALVSVVGFIIRRQTIESMEFLQTKTDLPTVPFIKVWTEDRKGFMLSISLGLFNGVLSYTLFSFLSIYISKYVGFSLSQGIFYNIFGLLAFMTLCPVFGAFSDEISPVNALKLAGRLNLVLPLVAFLFFQLNNVFSMIIGQLILGTAAASCIGPNHYFLQILFPTNNRYTGAALGFTIGMAITGGSTPLILTYLLDKLENLYIPAVYITLWACFWLFALRTLYHQVRVHYKMPIAA